MNMREITLQRIVLKMREAKHGLSIKNRALHFHVYPDCFVGQEFVTWALFNHFVDTRQQAIMLGQDLLDRGIIFHVTNDQPFRDGNFFYAFQNFPEISDSELDVIVMRMKAHPTGVSIQDRTYHLRTHKDCFVGKEAVDWLVKNVPKYAPNRQVATKLGQELMNKGLVHSASQQPFVDGDEFYFFQRPVHAGYLGKLNKAGNDWKIRWFAVRDLKEKKLWYYNSPRDPVPRDFIPLEDACLRVVLDAEIGFMEILTNLQTFSLRPTSSVLLARWVACLSKLIGSAGDPMDNLRMEHAERSVLFHEHYIASFSMHKAERDGLPLAEWLVPELEREDQPCNAVEDGEGIACSWLINELGDKPKGLEGTAENDNTEKHPTTPNEETTDPTTTTPTPIPTSSTTPTALTPTSSTTPTTPTNSTPPMSSTPPFSTTPPSPTISMPTTPTTPRISTTPTPTFSYMSSTPTASTMLPTTPRTVFATGPGPGPGTVENPTNPERTQKTETIELKTRPPNPILAEIIATDRTILTSSTDTLTNGNMPYPGDVPEGKKRTEEEDFVAHMMKQLEVTAEQDRAYFSLNESSSSIIPPMYPETVHHTDPPTYRHPSTSNAEGGMSVAQPAHADSPMDQLFHLL